MSGLINNKIIYSDFNTGFEKHPVTNDLSRLTNEYSVIRAVKNLILTDYYERPFKPGIGSGIRKLLFENYTQTTQTLIEKAIRETLDTYEPRANLINVSVTPYEDYNSVSITIVFSIINKEEPITLDFLLDRIR